MEKTVFYVAVLFDYFNPTVVEKFENRADADSYAALLSRTKQRKYIVLEQVTEWGRNNSREITMKRQELRDYLVDEAEYSEEDVAHMTDREMLDAWLIYNGICGFTDDILDVLEALGVHKKWY